MLACARLHSLVHSTEGHDEALSGDAVAPGLEGAADGAPEDAVEVLVESGHGGVLEDLGEGRSVSPTCCRGGGLLVLLDDARRHLDGDTLRGHHGSGLTVWGLWLELVEPLEQGVLVLTWLHPGGCHGVV